MLFPKKKQKIKKEMFYMDFVSHCCCSRYFPATSFKKHDFPLFYFLNQVLKGHARYRILHNLWMKVVISHTVYVACGAKKNGALN